LEGEWTVALLSESVRGCWLPVKSADLGIYYRTLETALTHIKKDMDKKKEIVLAFIRKIFEPSDGTIELLRTRPMSSSRIMARKSRTIKAPSPCGFFNYDSYDNQIPTEGRKDIM